METERTVVANNELNDLRVQVKKLNDQVEKLTITNHSMARSLAEILKQPFAPGANEYAITRGFVALKAMENEK